MALACSLLALGACYRHDHAAPLQQGVATSLESQHFARQMEAGMQKMMDDMHAPGYTGHPDVDFLAMMIPHHAGAVEMARLVLIHGKDPVTRQLAEEIIVSQTSEIGAMRQRLAILRQTEDPNPGGFPALHGIGGTAPRWLGYDSIG